jgi:Periplasmic component of the Tol biopolymer transport system
MPLTTVYGGKNALVFAKAVLNISGEWFTDSDLYLIKWDPALAYSYTYNRKPVLFTTGGIEWTPFISKDCKIIAYAKGGVGINGSIFYVTTDDALRNGIYSSYKKIDLNDIDIGPLYPDFSSDGTKIVYSATKYGGPVYMLYVLDTLSGKDDHFTFNHGVTPSWSPTGDWIVYSHSNGTQHDLFLKNYSTGEQIQLTNTPDFDELRPKFSPDGMFITFERYKINDSTSCEICLIQINRASGTFKSGTSLCRITPEKEQFSWMKAYDKFPDTPAPSWFTFDQLIIFNSIIKGRVGQDLSYRIPVFGGEPPYTYSLKSTLPQGLTFQDGVISGKPTSIGNYKLTIEVTDRAGKKVNADYDITIEGPEFRLTLSDIFLSRNQTINIDLTKTINEGTPPFTFNFLGNAPEGLTIENNVLKGIPTYFITKVKLVVEDGTGQKIWPEFFIYRLSVLEDEGSFDKIKGLRLYPYSSESGLSLYIGSGIYSSYRIEDSEDVILSNAYLQITETPDGAKDTGIGTSIGRGNLVFQEGNYLEGDYVYIKNLDKQKIFWDRSTPYETVRAKVNFEYTATLNTRVWKSGQSLLNQTEIILIGKEPFYVDTGDLVIVRDSELYYSFRFSNFDTDTLDWNLYRDFFGCGDLYDCICLDGCPCCDATALCCWWEPTTGYIYDHLYSGLAKNGNCFGMVISAWKTRGVTSIGGEWTKIPNFGGGFK